MLDELSRMQSSVSELQECNQNLQQEMRSRLQEKEQTIKAQRKQVSAHTVISAVRDNVGTGSEAQGQASFRMSCIGFCRHEAILYVWQERQEAANAFPEGGPCV